MITFKSIINIQALFYVYENHPTVCSYALNYNHVQLDWLLKNNLVTISDKTNPRRILPTQRAEAIVTALLNAQIDESLVTLTPPETQPEPTTKPPLGIMPNRMWLTLRYNDLLNAIVQYNNAGQSIPVEWCIELTNLLLIFSQTPMSQVTDTFLLSALEPEQRVAILEILSSSDLTTILGYSATKADASRKIAQNETLSAQIELTLSYESLF